MNDLVISNQNALAELNLPVAKFTEDVKFEEVAAASSFLCRVQLFTGSSPQITEGRIGPGKFGYVKGKDQIEDLTNQFDCIPLCWRFKAMRLTGGAILSYHDPKSEQFKKIQADSELPNSGCVYGPEFMIWVPQVKAFATFLFGSKTSRRVAGDMKGLLDSRRNATLKSTVIKTPKFTWHGPVVLPCSTPLELPPTEDIQFQAEKFANPKDSEVEKVEAGTATDRVM